MSGPTIYIGVLMTRHVVTGPVFMGVLEMTSRIRMNLSVAVDEMVLALGEHDRNWRTGWQIKTTSYDGLETGFHV